MIPHEYGEPFSLVISRAISSARPWIACDSDDRSCARSSGAMRVHSLLSNASRAAATALSMSGVVPSGT